MAGTRDDLEQAQDVIKHLRESEKNLEYSYRKEVQNREHIERKLVEKEDKIAADAKVISGLREDVRAAERRLEGVRQELRGLSQKYDKQTTKLEELQDEYKALEKKY